MGSFQRDRRASLLKKHLLTATDKKTAWVWALLGSEPLAVGYARYCKPSLAYNVGALHRGITNRLYRKTDLPTPSSLNTATTQFKAYIDTREGLKVPRTLLVVHGGVSIREH